MRLSLVLSENLWVRIVPTVSVIPGLMATIGFRLKLDQLGGVENQARDDEWRSFNVIGIDATNHRSICNDKDIAWISFQFHDDTFKSDHEVVI